MSDHKNEKRMKPLGLLVTALAEQRRAKNNKIWKIGILEPTRSEAKHPDFELFSGGFEDFVKDDEIKYFFFSVSWGLSLEK